MMPSLRTLFLKSVIPALTLLALSAPSFAGADDKTTICHIPPDDPDNVKILSVSGKAAAQHIARHGDLDLEGAVETCDGIDNDCDRETDEDFPDLGNDCFSEGQGECQAPGFLM